jgi:predicted enzyme related to lactoylglutathione lyase
MSQPSSVILYVDDPLASAEFYGALVGRKPVDASPGFALFVLEGGLKLGLWKRADVEPKDKGIAGTSELCIELKGDPAVDATFAEWKSRGLQMAQSPTKMDFGYTFVALDPDGHRLRVFAPA